MFFDYAMPGTMAVLKALFRSGLGVDVKDISIAKGLIAFPSDMAFLSFSFGAITLARAPEAFTLGSYAKASGLFFAVSILVYALVHLVSKKSELRFDISKDDDNRGWIRLTMACYGMSVVSIIYSLMLVR